MVAWSTTELAAGLAQFSRDQQKRQIPSPGDLNATNSSTPCALTQQKKELVAPTSPEAARRVASITLDAFAFFQERNYKILNQF
jgi:hypothetical protein